MVVPTTQTQQEARRQGNQDSPYRSPSKAERTGRRRRVVLEGKGNASGRDPDSGPRVVIIHYGTQTLDDTEVSFHYKTP